MNKWTSLSLTGPAVILTTTLCLTSCASSDDGDRDQANSTPTASTAIAPATPVERNAGASASPAEAAARGAAHNAADEKFLSLLRDHVRQLPELVNIIRGKTGVSDEVKDVASRLLSTQEGAVAQLGDLARDRVPAASPGAAVSPAGTPMSEPQDTPGKPSEKNLRALRDADGDDAAELFLTLMMEHHEGAIEIARNELLRGENPRLLAWSKEYIDARDAELIVLNDLRQAL